MVFRQLGQVFFDRSPFRKKAAIRRVSCASRARPLIPANYRPIPPPPREPIYLLDRAFRPSVVTFRCLRPSSAMLFAHYLSPRWIERFNCSSASVSLAVISLISRKGEDSKDSLSGIRDISELWEDSTIQSLYRDGNVFAAKREI